MTVTRFWAPLAAALALTAAPALASIDMDEALQAQMTELGYAVEELGELTEEQIAAIAGLFEADHAEDELRAAIDAVLDGDAEDDA